MKKYLLLITMLLVMVLGINNVYALDEVTVYFFRGNTCPHCEESLDFINNNKDKIDAKIKIVTYEVWKNTHNERLHQAVAKAVGVPDKSLDSVPFIVVGNDYKIGMNPTLEELNSVISMANKYLNGEEEYTDIVSEQAAKLKKENRDLKFKALTIDQLYGNNPVATYIVFGVFGVLVIGFVCLIVFSRKN